jgi:hypothetical protein
LPSKYDKDMASAVRTNSLTAAVHLRNLEVIAECLEEDIPAAVRADVGDALRFYRFHFLFDFHGACCIGLTRTRSATTGESARGGGL